MDIGRIIELASKAVEIDDSSGVTRAASELNTQLSQLASNPADEGAQTNVSKALHDLKQSLELAHLELSPDEVELIGELANAPIFSETIATKVEQTLLVNPATPAIARDALTEIMQERDTAFSHFRQFMNTSKALGWDIEQVEDWDAEVGFQIPREIFDNQFDGLIAEFRFIRRFLANVSEISGSSVSDVKLARLSTTDPWILLGVAYAVARQVGLITKWALGQWKTVEEIRHIREQTAKLKSFSPEDVENIFGDKIREEIRAGIEEQVKGLTSDIKPAARRHELSNGLRKDLHELLGRIERGMKVEVRLIADDEAIEGNEEVGVREEEMKNIVSGLKFPPPSPNPVLQLTQQEPS